MDNASKDRLAKLHPELAKRVTATIAGLSAKGLDVRVVQGLRTYAEQNALYEQGRSRKGAKVTNARGGFSNHNFGLAVDCCPFKSGKPDWNDNKAFNAIGAEGKKNGLNWGGDWKSLVDKPHLELPSGLTTKACRDLYGKGGLNAVWKQASAKLGIPFSAADNQPSGGPSTADKGTKSAMALAGDPAEQPPPTNQIADTIVNTGDQSNTPPPEDKTLVAPSKDGATATSTKMVVAGVVVPPTVAAIIKTISDVIQQGFVDAHEVGSFLLTMLTSNLKWILALVGLLIVLLIIKKIIKTITFWLTVISQMVPSFNNIHVTAEQVEPPKSPWWKFWRA